MNLFHYILAGIYHACVFTDPIAKPFEFTHTEETFFYSSNISRDVRGILGANSPEFGIGGIPEGLKFSDPSPQMPSKRVSSGTSLPTDSKPMSNEGRNQSAHANGGGKPSDEFSDTHKLLVGLAILIFGLLAIQWATWDIVRRIYRKLNDRAP